MTHGLQFVKTREHFLGVDLTDLRARMQADPRLSDKERRQLHALFEMAAARLHFEYHRNLEQIKAIYAPHDPDHESPLLFQNEVCDAGGRVPIRNAFEELLLAANYAEMPAEQIAACVAYDSRKGLRVKASLADYDDLRVFYRGVQVQERAFRSWLTPWKRRSESVHVLSRVVMFVCDAAAPQAGITLKLFKDVVAEDLEMLLPHVHIRMRLLDHLKVGSSVTGGAVTAIWKAVTAAVISPWVLLMVLFGFTGAAVRSVMGFLSRKSHYMQALTNKLYFQNLANNSSALAHLIDAAEAEKLKELLLAYYLLYTERDRDHTETSLDRRVEEWLLAEFGVESDFEVDDALNGLADKGLLVRMPLTKGTARGSEVLRVYDLPSALRRLDETWDEFFQYQDKRLPSDDRLADKNWPPLETREIVPGLTVRRIDSPHGPAVDHGSKADSKAVVPRRHNVAAPFNVRRKS
jgi:hypothetical protein